MISFGIFLKISFVFSKSKHCLISVVFRASFLVFDCYCAKKNFFCFTSGANLETLFIRQAWVFQEIRAAAFHEIWLHFLQVCVRFSPFVNIPKMNGTQKNLGTPPLSHMFLRLHILCRHPAAGRSTKEVPSLPKNFKKNNEKKSGSICVFGRCYAKFFEFFCGFFKFLGEITQKIRFFFKNFFIFPKKTLQKKYFFLELELNSNFPKLGRKEGELGRRACRCSSFFTLSTHPSSFRVPIIVHNHELMNSLMTESQLKQSLSFMETTVRSIVFAVRLLAEHSIIS